MIDDVLEQKNEADRLFSFRLDALAISNFLLLYRTIRYSEVVYAVFLLFQFASLVLNFIASFHHIHWEYSALIPVFCVFHEITRRMRKAANLSFFRVRVLSFLYYACFFSAVSIMNLFSVSEKPFVEIFPLLLVAFAGLYMDRLYVVLLFEAVYVGLYEMIAFLCGQLTQGRINFGIASLFVSVLLYWSVLGIYTEERRDNRLLEEKSSTDGLTGLLNKTSFEEEARYFIDHRKDGVACALIVLDFDNFKSVNDDFGHQIGDMALKKFGEILRTNFRAIDILGRVGGDEFMVLTKSPSDEEFLIKRCNRVLMELGTARFGEAKGFSCSIGIARDPEGFSFDRLYHLADDALYEAKARGKAQYVLWNTKKIVPQDKRAIYIASPNRGKIEAIRQICGKDYIYLIGENATCAFNEISLYGEGRLESVYFDYQQPDMPEEQIRAYMESRPLYQAIPLHDLSLELREYDAP
ncbi:MAG: GGDEF domain-containing protein [Lachnospiraceae bacterium]|nr:GGDEF domain-containing protein [Lachnospiraceae bacterium]